MDLSDYIIIGSGSAGLVLAARLAEDGRHSVCVLEAGPSDTHPMILLQQQRPEKGADMILGKVPLPAAVLPD